MCSAVYKRLGTRTGAVNTPMGGTSAAGLFQLVPKRCSCPVEADSGISGRNPDFVCHGFWIFGTFEIG